MATMLANEIKVNYRFDGPLEAPVVMLSNSLLTCLDMWNAQVATLSSEYRLLRYDTRGHGGTEATPGPYSIDLLAHDAICLIDALEIPKVHFIGLSMGGIIGQYLAARRSSRLLSVTLCDTACEMPPRSIWDDRIELARTHGVSALVKPMTERWLTSAFRRNNPDTVEAIAAMISNTSLEGFLGCAQAIRDMDLVNMVSNIKVPALIIVGEHDPGTPVAAANVLHQAIAGSELKIISDAAHLSNVEQPRTFNEAVLQFLGRQPE